MEGLGGLGTVEDLAETTCGLGGCLRSSKCRGAGHGGECLRVPGGGAGDGHEARNSLNGHFLSNKAFPAGELAGSDLNS